MSVPPLVSTEWLAQRLDDPRVKVVDATFFLPGQGDARESFRRAHIPGAVFFDIDAVADAESPLPHMLPDAAAFATVMGELGIGNEDLVVAYSVGGPRVWWSLRAMGHDAVCVLDGGISAWAAEDRPTESGEPEPRPAEFHARPRPELVRDFDQVRDDLAAGVIVVDARPAERFRGEAPEPRPGLRGGHMPGATSLPSWTLFGPDGRYLPEAETRALLEAAGAGPDRPATATCGSGVTACMIALARARLGRWDTPVYDGSWAEWGGREDAPVATGAD